ncbi:hypothetical protein ACE38W_01705 [Chitinophaga sp. Hz27]|uniref:hypothetical protein n=1 Tax=Chitinophaga sp. Hz27 TaxID=3347169 RepID=UPI0035D96C52
MFNTLTSLLGTTIDAANIIAFLEQQGFKYPKKPFISNRSAETSYWLENKKLGLDLLFDAQPYLPEYPLVQGDKKGVFIPRLVSARWYNNKSAAVFPGPIDFNATFSDLIAALGTPSIKSSDISPIWLNEDGSESFYRWRVTLNKEKRISWGPEFTDEQRVKDIVLALDYSSPLFHLYNEINYETLTQFEKEQSFSKISTLMFLQWALDRELIAGDGYTSVLDWVRSINRGYVTKHNFAAEQVFINTYTLNLSGHDVHYHHDLAFTFLKDPAQRNNYLGAASMTTLNAIPFDREHYDMVVPILDRRLKEYQQHKFAKSKKQI